MTDTPNTNADANPFERHPRTKAAKATTDLETAKIRPPTVQQILTDQQHTPAETIDQHGNVVKPTAPLPVPLEPLTEAQRAEYLRRNMAVIGTQQMTFIYFEGQKNRFEIGGEELPPAAFMSVCCGRRSSAFAALTARAARWT
jgi:hypothetical protein